MTLPTIAQIQTAVARECKVDVAAMKEPAPHGTGRSEVNTFDKSHPRQAAMALSVLLTEHSLVRIGHFFGGRDHSTVIHACRAVAKRRRNDAKLHETMRRLSLELIGAGR